jgi:hypothetical protein
MAHEFGHNLGLAHDFLGDLEDRYDSQGNLCTGINGVMDYTRYFDKWTTCSYEDFLAADHSCF